MTLSWLDCFYYITNSLPTKRLLPLLQPNNNMQMNYQSLAIGGKDLSLFIYLLPPQIISIRLDNKCRQKIETGGLNKDDEIDCITKINTTAIKSENWQFIAANRDYLALVTKNNELWYTTVNSTLWQLNDDVNQKVSFLTLNPIDIPLLVDLNEFIIVSVNNKVYHGVLDIPGGVTRENIFPYPGVNGDNEWDWPSNASSIAISSKVFYAGNDDGLQYLPAWTIFDPEWWRTAFP